MLSLRSAFRQVPRTVSARQFSHSEMVSAIQDLYFTVDSAGKVKGDGAESATITAVEAAFKASRSKGKAGEVVALYGLGAKGEQTVVLVGTGEAATATATTEAAQNKLKEESRRSAALASLALVSPAVNSTSFLLSPHHSAHATAVGSHLALHNYSLKTTTKVLQAKVDRENLKIECSPIKAGLENEQATKEGRNELNWATGVIYAKAQNLARELMETPANLMNPTIFTERAGEKLKGKNNVEFLVHDLAWAESKKMNSFISVSRGSSQPLKFIEAHYRGAKDKSSPPTALVGKGITFDSGGISIKGAAGMDLMRGDMGGAAVTLSAFIAAVELELPINLDLFIPLTENLLGPSATKPGDVVIASNGVSITIDNTDAEGRLVLADALVYASSFSPHTIIDAATLTGAMVIALGEQYTGVFTNSDSLFEELDRAGKAEHDEVWRMPLSEGYLGQIGGSNADLINTGGRAAGSCTAALFLKRFVGGLIIDGVDSKEDPSTLVRWAHLDIAGVMDTAKNDAYHRAGMTGRPTRTLIELLRRAGDKV